MKITRRQLRKLVSEIVQVPTPKPGQRMVHKVEEDVTEEMLVDSLYERKHRTKRINETMENPPFQFSINPKDYINKDEDVEEINQMIRLILDSEEINYSSMERLLSRRPSVGFQFGYVDDESPDPDPRSYQAYLELTRILEEIGFPTHEDVLDDRTLRYKTYISFSDEVNDNGTQVGYIFIHQYTDRRK
jgi:hypothetical protein